MKPAIHALLTFCLLFPPLTSARAEDEVIPAEEMAGWKLTKSLAQPAPVVKIRKGLGVETGPSSPAAGAEPAEIEVKVDAASAFRFQNIQFALNSAELVGETTFRQLAEIAKAMEAASAERFLIEGHTCDLGEEATNLELSYRRALAVRAVLAGLGVPEARLQVLGLGESDRLDPGTSESARVRNRRVEIYRKL